jgi:hypothetical protein
MMFAPPPLRVVYMCVCVCAYTRIYFKSDVVSIFIFIKLSNSDQRDDVKSYNNQNNNT